LKVRTKFGDEEEGEGQGDGVCRWLAVCGGRDAKNVEEG
jgi:hypothetical protein